MKTNGKLWINLQISNGIMLLWDVKVETPTIDGWHPGVVSSSPMAGYGQLKQLSQQFAWGVKYKFVTHPPLPHTHIHIQCHRHKCFFNYTRRGQNSHSSQHWADRRCSQKPERIRPCRRQVTRPSSLNLWTFWPVPQNNLFITMKCKT